MWETLRLREMGLAHGHSRTECARLRHGQASPAGESHQERESRAEPYAKYTYDKDGGLGSDASKKIERLVDPRNPQCSQWEYEPVYGLVGAPWRGLDTAVGLMNNVSVGRKETPWNDK